MKAVGSSRRSHVVALEFVGQRGTRILELVMDGFLDLHVALLWWVCKVRALAFR